ncbi:MAG: hypothetical protein M3041_18235 [Acidobacteriota bacterium]|nr:hypothetical protein [Acidobacteriota bacterium]
MAFAWILAAAVLLFIAATANSKATRISRSLGSMVKTVVRIEVWGNAIPDPSRPMFQIDSIAGVGAGLLIHVRESSGGPRILLKVAQPRAATVLEDRVEITGAAYVSWAGGRLKRSTDAHVPAVVLYPCG